MDLGSWEPASLEEVAAIFAGFPAPWWIAGGYAIEPAVGGHIREHGDIDVLILRPHHGELHRVMAEWELWAADPPGVLRPWCRETLPDGVHDIWCRPFADAPWRIQVMLDEADGEDWVCRRDPALRLPLASIGRLNDLGIPYLAPEIQLYYKSRRHRPKDRLDFDAVRGHLDAVARHWLARALPLEHPWRDLLG